MPETDKLARFVGLEAYQAEGGAITGDLFTEDDTRWLCDRELLIRLAEAKLQPIAEGVGGEGWAWVEITVDSVAWQHYPERVRERRRDLSAEDKAEQDRLYQALDATNDEAEIETIEAAIDALVASAWQPEEVKIAGAVITLAQDGAPKVERGLVKLDDVKALRAIRRKLSSTPQRDSGASDETAAPPAKSSLSAKLREELVAHKTLALRAELLARPELAFRLLVFALAGQMLGGPASCLGVRIEDKDVSRAISRSYSKAAALIEARAQTWRDRLPAKPEALWAFCQSADRDTLMEIVAVAIAPGLDLARPTGGDVLAELVADSFGLDMSNWWSATPESYFAHVRKDVLIDAIKEAKSKLDRTQLEKASKAELLARTRRVFKGSTWLPELLRCQASVQSGLAVAAE